MNINIVNNSIKVSDQFGDFHVRKSNTYGSYFLGYDTRKIVLLPYRNVPIEGTTIKDHVEYFIAMGANPAWATQGESYFAWSMNSYEFQAYIDQICFDETNPLVYLGRSYEAFELTRPVAYYAFEWTNDNNICVPDGIWLKEENLLTNDPLFCTAFMKLKRSWDLKHHT